MGVFHVFKIVQMAQNITYVKTRLAHALVQDKW